jgi:uncharacterized protein
LLLATGDSRYADQVERTLYNAVISGVSLSGGEFSYVNTLRVRNNTDADDQHSAVAGRQPWYGTACCPPNGDSGTRAATSGFRHLCRSP